MKPTRPAKPPTTTNEQRRSRARPSISKTVRSPSKGVDAVSEELSPGSKRRQNRGRASDPSQKYRPLGTPDYSLQVNEKKFVKSLLSKVNMERDRRSMLGFVALPIKIITQGILVQPRKQLL